MPKRWLVKRRLLVVLEATMYTRIYGQQQFRKCGCVARSQSTSENICIKYFRMFSVYENIFTTKIKRITVYVAYANVFLKMVSELALGVFVLYDSHSHSHRRCLQAFQRN